MNTSIEDEQILKDETAHLESQLAATRANLASLHPSSSHSPNHQPPPPPPAYHHHLLLLSDSALPLGSFAFSSGLESYLAHHPPPSPRHPPIPSGIQPFLSLALQTLAASSLPYLLAAYKEPGRLLDLDEEYDATVLCNVARRASVSQGRALMMVWERSLRGSSAADDGGDPYGELGRRECSEVLKKMSLQLKKAPLSSTATTTSTSSTLSSVSGIQVASHFPPLWAVVTRALGIPIHDSANLFLVNHAKAVLSAAVRASVMGPYQAQAVLGSAWLREEVRRLMSENWNVQVEDAGQVVPVMDLWVGRHELLYSRIFNS
ncbi:MAG: hypothetical protein L6R37_001522 [Teloschistes peruensis]|nr:MAG: hypothetical protein L6R37_001522 [Teloschistes peruensis]